MLWLFNRVGHKGRNPNLQKFWKCPYEVVTRINDKVYRIRSKAKLQVVHLDRLASYRCRPQEDDIDGRNHQGSAVASCVAANCSCCQNSIISWKNRATNGADKVQCFAYGDVPECSTLGIS